MKKIMFSVVLVSFVLGCGAHGLIGTLPKIDNTDEAAEIYIIRVSSFNAKIMNFRILLDGRQLIGIGNGEYTKFYVSPREHTMGVVTKKGLADRATLLNVDCESKGKYYFLIKPSYSSAKISQISEGEAKPHILKGKYLNITGSK